MDMSNKMWSDEGWAHLLSELMLVYTFGDVLTIITSQHSSMVDFPKFKSFTLWLPL